MHRRLLIAAIAAALTAVVLPAPAQASTGPIIPSSLFGQHVMRIATTGAVPTAAGSIRLWDVGARWAELQPTAPVLPLVYDDAYKATINFAPLDAAVARARAAGVRDIMYVLGSTPAWAKTPADPAVEAGDLYGPGTSSHPANDDYYLFFLRAVVERYGSQITSYQIWNESNLTTFYRGNPWAMAYLTKKSYDLIKSLNPAARVVGPSWLLRSWPTARDAQLKTLRAVGWPVDALSVHSYPFSAEGPDQRLTRLRSFKTQLASLGYTKQLWDTEVNYGDRRPGYPYKVYTSSTAQMMVARTYIDSRRWSIAKTYWYAWDNHILGIDMISPTTGARTSAGTAFFTVRSWMAGSGWNGCTTASTGLNRCKLTTTSGAKRSILYSTKSTVKMIVPKGGSSVCTLSGSCRSVKAGSAIYVTKTPVLLRGA